MLVEINGTFEIEYKTLGNVTITDIDTIETINSKLKSGELVIGMVTKCIRNLSDLSHVYNFEIIDVLDDTEYNFTEE